MTSWVGPWVPFSKLSRLKAIETCEILIEQRDRQIRRAEAAEAALREILALGEPRVHPSAKEARGYSTAITAACEIARAALLGSP